MNHNEEHMVTTLPPTKGDKLIARLKLTVHMTKSQGKKLIRDSKIHCCIDCFTEFSTKKKLERHLKGAKKHRANPADLKKEYEELRKVRHQPEHERAYLFAFLRVLLLERFL